jgi:hypothetical protein
MRYTSTKLVSGDSFSTIKVGQWVKLCDGATGQYMGTTAQGVDVINWKKSVVFNKTMAKANKPLRVYAKVYGAK